MAKLCFFCDAGAAVRSLDAEALAALRERRTVPRDFLWFSVRNFSTGALYSEGYWSDHGTVTAEVDDVEAGAVVQRDYVGSQLVSIGPVVLESGTAAQTLTITLAQASDRVANLIQGYDAKQARVQLHRGMMHRDTGLLVAPAHSRFLGWVNTIDIPRAAEGRAADVQVFCVSDSQELGRSNPSIRSDADQRARFATDDFFADTATAGELAIFWGVKNE